MITMEKGKNLDVALKELEDAENLVDIVMPGTEEAVADEKSKEEAPVEEVKEEAPAEESSEEKSE